MTNPPIIDVYTFCTRCGTALPAALQQRYRESHRGGPVLCRECCIAVVRECTQAFHPVVRASTDALTDAITPLVEAFADIEFTFDAATPDSNSDSEEACDGE